ncbi:hypothetical protein [Bacteroides congonensis]|nr:MAG TPA: hypothetical protein [Caudoviricetes sp.]
MKKEDLNLFKGEIKDAIQQWVEGKIDTLFPQKAATKTFFKNAFDNLLSREDSKISKWLDTAFLFIADKDGTIDSDVMIDTINSIFKEMDIKEYDFGLVHVVIGKGEAVVGFPRNILFDMLVGKTGSVKFTSEDIGELKDFLN